MAVSWDPHETIFGPRVTHIYDLREGAWDLPWDSHEIPNPRTLTLTLSKIANFHRELLRDFREKEIIMTEVFSDATVMRRLMTRHGNLSLLFHTQFLKRRLMKHETPMRQGTKLLMRHTFLVSWASHETLMRLPWDVSWEQKRLNFMCLMRQTSGSWDSHETKFCLTRLSWDNHPIGPNNVSPSTKVPQKRNHFAHAPSEIAVALILV